MNIAWSIGFVSSSFELVISTHLRIAWFIGAIVGALAGVLIGKRLGYKLLMVSGTTWKCSNLKCLTDNAFPALP